MSYIAGRPIQNFTQPQMVFSTPAAGSNVIPVKHVVGCAWPMQRGVFLSPADYTEDANGFYLTNITADGVEAFGVWLLSPINVSGMMTGNNPIITQGGLTFADGTVQSSAAIGRNRIINGDFRVNQRGGATPPVGVATYTVDRWTSNMQGAAGLCTNLSGGMPSFSTATYFRATGVAGNTANNVFSQRVEAANIADLSGRPVTISGWFIKTQGGTVQININCPTSPDNGATDAVIMGLGPYNLPANIWTYIVANFTLPTQAINGVRFAFVTGQLLAGDYFAFSDIQVEQGTVLNPIFERRTLAQEIAMCQRYYERFGAYTFWPTNAPGAGQDCRQFTPFQVSKRITPSMACTGGSLTNLSTNTFQGVTYNGFTMRIVSAAAGLFAMDNAVVTADAEL